MPRTTMPTVVLLLATALLTGCSKSPAEAGEEYGSTIVHSDPMVKCIVEGVHRYSEDERDREEFREACIERGNR